MGVREAGRITEMSQDFKVVIFGAADHLTQALAGLFEE